MKLRPLILGKVALSYNLVQNKMITWINLACSAGGFGGLSSGLPLFWIHCRLGELGRE